MEDREEFKYYKVSEVFWSNQKCGLRINFIMSSVYVKNKRVICKLQISRWENKEVIHNLNNLIQSREGGKK